MTDYIVSSVIRSERYADQVVLSATQLNVDQLDNRLFVALPEGFGQCLIMEWQMFISNVALLQIFATVNPPPGMDTFIQEISGGNNVDFVGASPLFLSGHTGTYELAAHGSPNQLVIWKPTEYMLFNMIATESATADESDFYASIRVRRLRTP